MDGFHEDSAITTVSNSVFALSLVVLVGLSFSLFFFFFFVGARGGNVVQGEVLEVKY